MTQLDETQVSEPYGHTAELDTRWQQPQQRRHDEPREQSQLAPNVGDMERAVSVAAGSILALLGVSRRSVPGLLVAAVGGAMIHRGVTGHCYGYQALGIDTAHEQDQNASDESDILKNGVHIETSFLINRPAEDCYNFWRNFQNLPQIMSHIDSITVDGNRSHWVARTPGIPGYGTVQWDAEITDDQPNQRIAWRSVGDSQIDTAGEIRFNKAVGDRGTEVHVHMHYVPPAGKLGHLIASMLGNNPKRLVREDLRNFKRIMEIGELLTIIGQSHGTCTGQGKEYTESEWKPLAM